MLSINTLYENLQSLPGREKDFFRRATCCMTVLAHDFDANSTKVAMAGISTLLQLHGLKVRNVIAQGVYIGSMMYEVTASAVCRNATNGELSDSDVPMGRSVGTIVFKVRQLPYSQSHPLNSMDWAEVLRLLRRCSKRD